MRKELYKIIEYKKEIDIENIFNNLKDKKSFIFLDSSLISKNIGRYSIFTYEPFLEYKSTKKDNDPLKKLSILLKLYKSDFYDSRVPFISGAMGYFSYELVNTIEVLPNKKSNIINMPDIHVGFYNKGIIVDHFLNKTYIVVSSFGIENKTNEELDKNINIIKSDIDKNNINNDQRISNTKNEIKLTSNFTKSEYIEKVKIAKEYIKNGDIYQVNFSQRFSCKTQNKPWEIYKKLRIKNKAPFCVYLNLGDIFILSSSPERFIKTIGSQIETRPIKGTRKRGNSFDEDKQLRRELLESKKDKAELTMIIDLERNDLGRICEFGSVKVEKMYYLENYESVIHMVSKIIGKIKKNIDIIDVLKSTFPGGSITGAPKIRSMEIINELENCSRNVYTGSIGYIDFNGNSDFNIAIRTIIIQNDNIIFNVGGGIVADSIPEDEFQETLHKGKAIIETLLENIF